MNGWVQLLVALGALVGLISPVLFRVQRRAIAGGARLAEAQSADTLVLGAMRRIENLEKALQRAEDKIENAETRADQSDAKADHCQREIEGLRDYIGELRGDFRRETGKEPRPMPTPLPWPRPLNT